MIWVLIVIIVSFLLDIIQLREEQVNKKDYIFYSVSMIIVLVYAVIYYKVLI